MATTVARLEAILSANTRDFDRAMNQSESKMHKLGNAAKLGGLAIAGGLAVGLEKSIHAGMEAEASQARLRQAFKTAGISAKTYKDRVEELEKSGRKLGFTDDEVRGSLGSLVVATHNMKKSARDLAVAQDIARFKGVGLQDATKMLTMAMGGSQRAAKQLGLSVQAVTDAQDKAREAYKKTVDAIKAHFDAMGKLTPAEEKQKQAALDAAKAHYEHANALAKVSDKQTTAAKVIDLVKDKLHGQADAYSKTAKGAMEEFRAQVQHVEEWIGLKLIPAFELAVAWVRDHWPEISAHIKEVWVAVQPTIRALIDLVVSFVTMIRKHWGTIGPIVTQVVNIVKAQLQILTGVIKFFAALLRGDWSAAWDALKGIVRGVFNELKALLKLQLTILKDAAVAVGHAIVAGVKAGIEGAWQLLKTAVTDLFHKVIEWAKDALGIHSPSSVFHEIGVNMIKGMVNGVGSMGGFLKKAVVNLAKSAYHGVTGFFSGAQSSGSSDLRGLVPKVQHALQFARNHGWHGVVTSGYRTYAEQAALYQRYLQGGPLAAAPGTSSHERGEAVDVTDVGGFARAMAQAPGFERLYNYLGARDPVHWSVSGYDKGGWLPPGLSLAYNGTGAPEPVGAAIGGDINLYVDGQKLFSWFRNAERRENRRNGR